MLHLMQQTVELQHHISLKIVKFLKIKQLELYGYCIDFISGGKGIVLAEDIKEAKQKVIKAYLKHGYSVSELSNVDVWKINRDDNNFFEDSSDVLEVWE